MLRMEEWQQIRHLAAQQRSQRSIAEELGISRNTVAKALADEAPPRYARAGRPCAKLEPWRERTLAGVRRGLSGVRLL